MFTIPHLESHFRAARKRLVTIGEQAFLLTERGEITAKAPGFAVTVTIDLEKALARFASLTEDFEDPFTVAQVSALTGMSVYSTYRRISDVIGGEPRKFTPAEAFALVITESFRRKNVSEAALRRAAQFIVGVTNPVQAETSP